MTTCKDRLVDDGERTEGLKPLAGLAVIGIQNIDIGQVELLHPVLKYPRSSYE